MKRILIVLFIAVTLAGCCGCGVNVMKKIDAAIPMAEFEEFSLQENFGPAVNFSIEAKNAKRTGDTIMIEEIIYNRAGNVTSARFVLKGYKRQITHD